ALLLIVLFLALYKPYGIINFDELEGRDVLIAEREGAANCMTTFKLKEGNKFTERSFCFGPSEIKGHYRWVNDTLFFEDVEPGLFYEFALVKRSSLSSFHLVRYKSMSDTTGHELWITKNELEK
ncbi:MAG: hypothetical protein V4658_02585, partial [Bacteroidota bacterium]